MSPDEVAQRVTLSGGFTPAGEVLELLVELSQIYEDRGVAGTNPLPPLHEACSSAPECWAGCTKRPSGTSKEDPNSHNGCIILPWVGPHYRPGGVCVVGLNLRSSTDGSKEFAVENRIALDPKHGQYAALGGGHKAHRSPWAGATMRDAAAVIRALRGEPIATPSRNELAESLLQTARVQAVKCSPIGGRSSPTPAMTRNCPPRFFRREIDVLRPRVLLVYGSGAHAAIRQLGALRIGDEDNGFRRATVEGRTETVMLLRHPAARGWRKSHDAMVKSLLANPLISTEPLEPQQTFTSRFVARDGDIVIVPPARETSGH